MSRAAILAFSVCTVFCLSCVRQVDVVCTPFQNYAHTYAAVLNTIGVEARIREGGKQYCIFVPAREHPYAQNVISNLSRYADEGLTTHNSVLSTFVPVLRSHQDELLFSIKPLSNLTGVLKVSCKEKQTVCEIWYYAGVISEQLLRTHIPKTLNIEIIFHNVQPFLENYIQQQSRNLSEHKDVVVLEPFTFHVPTMEKDIAGLQLILVLGVFLLSGFVIGFWFGTKERKEAYEK